MIHLKVKLTDLEPVLPVVMPMMSDHYKEISHLPGEFNPDVGRYVYLNKIGAWVFICAYIGDDIVGYAGYFIGPHHHNKDCIVATQDLIYLAPICRGGGLGRKFITECDLILKDLGAHSIINAVSQKNDFGKLLESLGYTLLDKLYTRRL